MLGGGGGVLHLPVTVKDKTQPAGGAAFPDLVVDEFGAGGAADCDSDGTER